MTRDKFLHYTPRFWHSIATLEYNRAPNHSTMPLIFWWQSLKQLTSSRVKQHQNKKQINKRIDTHYQLCYKSAAWVVIITL